MIRLSFDTLKESDIVLASRNSEAIHIYSGNTLSPNGIWKHYKGVMYVTDEERMFVTLRNGINNYDDSASIRA